MATSFQSLPENVNFVGADLTGKHKGLWGLNSLYSELKRMHFDYVADFHHVLRSKYLCLRFRLANIPVAFICKGRAGKRNWFAAVIKCWRTRKVLSVVMLMC